MKLGYTQGTNKIIFDTEILTGNHFIVREQGVVKDVVKCVSGNESKIENYVRNNFYAWVLPGSWVDNAPGATTSGTPDTLQVKLKYTFALSFLTDADVYTSTTLASSFQLPSFTTEINGVPVTIPGEIIPAQTLTGFKTWSQIVAASGGIGTNLFNLVVPETVLSNTTAPSILFN